MRCKKLHSSGERGLGTLHQSYIVLELALQAESRDKRQAIVHITSQCTIKTIVKLMPKIPPQCCFKVCDSHYIVTDSKNLPQQRPHSDYK